MNNFFQDVLNQPADLTKAMTGYFSPAFFNTIQHIRNISYSQVLFTGMGSSHFGGIGPSLYLINRGIRSQVISTGQLLHYGRSLIDGDTLTVMISQSGESAEIVALLDKLKDKSKVIGITNNSSSTLAIQARHSLHLNVPDEESVTTRTYLATLIVTNLLARYLAGSEQAGARADFETAVRGLRELLDRYADRLEELKDFLASASFISCVGRGPSFGSAQAAGLFLKEVSKFPSEGQDAAEFRHGPQEICDDKFGLIVFAPQGRTGELGLRLARDIAAKGGKVVLITNIADVVNQDNLFVLRYAAVDEYLAPVAEIAGAQLVCNVLAERRGFIPGQFRWCNKITREE